MISVSSEAERERERWVGLLVMGRKEHLASNRQEQDRTTCVAICIAAPR